MKSQTNSLFAGLIISMMLVFGKAYAAELVVNGGFEAGGNLLGWKLQASNFTGITNEPSAVSKGSYALYGGQVGSNAHISQDIETVAGQSYKFSFDEKNFFGDVGSNDFQVFWDGNLLLDLFNAPTSAYTNYLFNVIATGKSTEIKFGLRNDPYMLALDNVSVIGSNPSAVPVPAAVWLFGSGITGLMRLKRKNLN